MDYQRLETLLIILSSPVFVSSTLGAASDGACPRHLPSTSQMAFFRGTCYQFVSQEKFWYQARDHCLRNGGRLVKIDDAQTNEFIVGTLNGLWWRNNGVWIGLHDSVSEMRWQWTGVELYQNDPVLWTNWGQGHPGAFLHSHRDCVRMVRNDNWKWHETFCNTMQWQYRFICEYNASNPGGAIAAKERRLLRGQSSPNRQTAVETGNMLEDLDGESIASDSDPEAAAIKSDDETDSNAAGHKQSAAVVVSIVCLLAGTVFLIVLFMFYRRRRRRNMEREYPAEVNCVVGSKGKKFDDVTNSFRPTAVSNVYVEADVIRGHVTTRLAAPKRADDIRCESSDEESSDVIDRSTKRKMIDSRSEEEDGEFDAVAKSANIYAEITEDDEDLSSENRHIYEALEEVKEKAAALTE